MVYQSVSTTHRGRLLDARDGKTQRADKIVKALEGGVSV
jgi:hypothetical protein